MREAIQTFLAGSIVVLLFYSFIGAGAGLFATVDARTGSLGATASTNDGCVYRSVAAYINPGYYAVCELFRARFNEEQPVEYKPEPKKTLE